MRAILHIGLFVLALTAVAQASADHDDDDRRRERRTTVVIAPRIEHRTVRPVRAPAQPMPRHYEWERGRHHRQRGIAEARREVYEQQRDHEQIVRITHRWTEARYNRNPYAQRNAERRVHVWIDREIEESSTKPGNGRYVQRLHSLRRELRVSNGYGRGYGRGLGHGYGRRPHRLDERKAQVLGELVELSERQVHRAMARARGQRHVAFAYR